MKYGYIKKVTLFRYSWPYYCREYCIDYNGGFEINENAYYKSYAINMHYFNAWFLLHTFIYVCCDNKNLPYSIVFGEII
jgi:hypothetical protein